MWNFLNPIFISNLVRLAMRLRKNGNKGLIALIDALKDDGKISAPEWRQLGKELGVFEKQ